MRKTIISFIILAAGLVVSACQSQRITVASDVISTEQIRTVRSSAFQLEMPGVTYKVALQAECDEKMGYVRWTLTLDSPHRIGSGQSLLMRTDDGQQFFLVSTQEGVLSKDEFVTRRGDVISRMKGYRAYYVMGENFLNILDGTEIVKLRIKNEAGYKDKILDKQQQTAMRQFFKEARNAMKKRLEIPADDMISKGF